MKGGIGNLMKQAQKMQAEMQEAQERLAREEVTGESGGGLVKITINGKHETRRVEIDDSLLQDDKEMLEDLIAAAINDANQRINAEDAGQHVRADRRTEPAARHQAAVLT